MFKRFKVALAALVLAVLMPSIAGATENGLITYPVGVNTVLDGILPPPGGTQFYNYTQYYVANKFAGPNGNSLLPTFRTSAFVDAPRVVHTWGTTLGPFTVSSGLIVPIFHLSVKVPGASGTRNALGDIIAQPFMVSYANQSHTFFAYVTGDIGLPTGAYSVNRVANTGLNTYAFMPSLNMTWFPTPKWEISTTALVELNSPNHATNYHSGAVATLDYLIGYSLNEKVQVGLQGYFLKQFTDDTVNGAPVPGGGFRGQAVGIGPQLRYNWAPAAGVAIKYQHEFAVRNRAQGEKFWVELSFPFN